MDFGFTNDDLFAGFHHPSGIGHRIIALGFIAKMQQYGPLSGQVIQSELPTMELTSLTVFVASLNVPNWFAQRLSFLRMRWHLFIGELAAEPRDYADQSVRHIEKYLELSEGRPEDVALASMFHAYVAAQIGDDARARDLAEYSLATSPTLVANLLNGEVFVGTNYLTGNWLDEFARVGLVFSEDTSTLMTAP